jgi:hypothetical protein
MRRRRIDLSTFCPACGKFKVLQGSHDMVPTARRQTCDIPDTYSNLHCQGACACRVHGLSGNLRREHVRAVAGLTGARFPSIRTMCVEGAVVNNVMLCPVNGVRLYSATLQPWTLVSTELWLPPRTCIRACEIFCHMRYFDGSGNVQFRFS